MAGRGGTSRMLQKLNANIEAGNYYEAHQMYRTLYFRYTAQNKYAEAIDLLYSGASKLLEHNQHTSGSDLALLLLETLKASKQEPTVEDMEKVARLHKLIDCHSPDRPDYVKRALLWSKGTSGNNFKGHPVMHQKLAITFWQEKRYQESRYHFVHSVDGESCAAMLVEYHTRHGYPGEVDLFIAQTVFQYLCLHNKATASVTFYAYTKRHPQVKNGPPFPMPLLNFLWFLLLAVDGGKLAVFSILCEQYQTSIKRDPSYNEYLDKIGQLFFGLPPPPSQDQGAGGLFGNLLRSLMGDEESDDEDRSLRPGPSSRSPASVLKPAEMEMD